MLACPPCVANFAGLTLMRIEAAVAATANLHGQGYELIDIHRPLN